MMNGTWKVRDGVKKMIEVLVRGKRQKNLHPIKGVDVTYYNRDKFIAVSAVDRESYLRLSCAQEIMIHIDYSDTEEEGEEIRDGNKL